MWYFEESREDVRVPSGGDVMDLAAFLALPSTLTVDRIERLYGGKTSQICIAFMDNADWKRLEARQTTIALVI